MSAVVHGDVEVACDGGLRISLRITARNPTPRLIRLREPYFVPARDGVVQDRPRFWPSGVEAPPLGHPPEGIRGWARFGLGEGDPGIELHVDRPERRGKRWPCVMFGDQTLPARSEVTWQLCYSLQERVGLQESTLFGPFEIQAQGKFQGLDVLTHVFETYVFRFEKPGPRWLRPLKTHSIGIHVPGPQAARKPSCSFEKRLSYTVLKLGRFVLNAGESMPLHFATTYRYHWPGRILWLAGWTLSIIVASVLSFLGQAKIRAALDWLGGLWSS